MLFYNKVKQQSPIYSIVFQPQWALINSIFHTITQISCTTIRTKKLGLYLINRDPYQAVYLIKMHE